MTRPGQHEIQNAIAALRGRYAQKAIRVQFGETMTALGREFPDFVCLTADLMYATGMQPFGQAFPERMINLGIAEQNMTGVAAGLALSGRLPVVCGYAAFTSLRAVEQAKVDGAYNNVKVVLAAQSAGLSYGVGGPTHQTFEDVAIMRAIPNTLVVVPSDANRVDACMRAVIELDTTRIVYVRLGRGPEYVYSAEAEPFAIGKVERLREGRDVAIAANGSMVFEALLAADYLASLGIKARVLDIHSVKPIDGEAVRDAARGVEAMIVIEEHSRLGGLGSAILECLAEERAIPVRLIGIPDIFPPVGPTHELRASLGLCADNIVHNALDLLAPAKLERSRQQ